MRELGPVSVTALEPGREFQFEEARINLAKEKISVLELTAQQASASHQRQFDVVTVFKYNVPLLEKREFAKSLAKLIKTDGVVIITAVEKDLLYKRKAWENQYIVDLLQSYFQYVEVEEIKHGLEREWMATCLKPRVN